MKTVLACFGFVSSLWLMIGLQTAQHLKPARWQVTKAGANNNNNNRNKQFALISQGDVLQHLQIFPGHTWESACHRYRCQCGGGCLVIPCLPICYHSSHLRQLRRQIWQSASCKIPKGGWQAFLKLFAFEFAFDAAVRNLKQLKQLK